MAKPRPKEQPEEQKPPVVDDRSRRAFLDELEGRVPVEAEAGAPKRRVRVTDDREKGPAVAPLPADSLEAVLPDRPKKSDPKPGMFDRAKHSSRWWVPLVIVLALAGVTVAGFLFFSRSTKFAGTNIGINFDLPTSVASGDTVEVVVRYHNDETVDIKSATLALVYPNGFTVTETSRTTTDDLKGAFELGTIRSGAVGEIVITGKVVGAVGTELFYSGTLSYRPANYNSDFQTTGSGRVAIGSSIVTLSLDGPANIAPGVDGNWTINYENTSDQELGAMQIEATLPVSLTVKKSEPKPTDGNNKWRLEKLAPSAKGKITVTGSLEAKSGDSAEFLVILSLIQTGGTAERQAEDSFLTAVVDSGLTVVVAANSATESSIIKPGDTLTYSIRLENNHDAEVSDVVVKAEFDGALFDLSKLQDPAKGILKDGVITWTKANVPDLGLIKAKDNVTITLTVPTIAPTPAKTDTDRNPQGTMTVTVSSPNIPSTSLKPVVAITKVQTTMNFSADARYYNDQGQAVGSGPVPPKVGQTTAYRVTWSVITTTNDVTGFAVTAILPNQVLWTGKNIGRDAGDIAFDPVSRTVTWNINKVPGGTGSRYAILTASFEVSVTPSADQVGSVVILSEAASATGTDDSTKQPVTATAESLTTDVLNDPTAAGEGKVVP